MFPDDPPNYFSRRAWLIKYKVGDRIVGNDLTYRTP